MTKENKSKQQFYFRRQIELAHCHNLPIIIHNRDAHEDTLNILVEMAEKGMLRQRTPVYFTVIREALSLPSVFKIGFYIGIDGPVTFKMPVKL